MSTVPGTSKNPTLAVAAQSDLAKAKRAHTRAESAVRRVERDNEDRLEHAKQRATEAAAALREAARREADRAPDLTPEKRAQLGVLLQTGLGEGESSA